MKILVCVKSVVDYSYRARAIQDGSGVDLTGARKNMNPFDEIALEEAIRLKEKGLAREIIAFSAGIEQAKEVLRSALAMGADRGIHVATSNEIIEPLAVAKIIKAIADRESPDLIIMGKQAIDDDANQTGQMLAALLKVAQATFASKLEITEDKQCAIVTREVDGGLMRVKVKLPAVITADLRLNEPRYITLPNIMKAKSKPIEAIDMQSLNVDTANRLEYIHYSDPAKRKKGIKVESVSDLFDKLKNTSVKVI